MRTGFAVWLIVLGVGGVSRVDAQEVAPGPGVVEVTVFPGGGTFFTEGKDTGAAEFGNYDVGGALAFNINRYFGVEAELTGALGVKQNLTRGGLTSDMRSPNFLNYTGNVVMSFPTGRGFSPYVTAGAGGLTLLEKSALDITANETFLTGNAGGGLKWHAGRWGLRADYRFIAVEAKDTAPAFWGNEERYGHRVYAGIVLNLVR